MGTNSRLQTEGIPSARAFAPLSTETNFSRMNVTAVCVSRYTEGWNVQDIPFYNYTEGWRPFQHEKTKERVAYLAERRNTAVSKALNVFPQTQHILMIDSYYVDQENQILKLVQEYAKKTLVEFPEGCILGASTWILDKTKIRSRFRFYDGWTTPEALELNPTLIQKQGGVIPVKAVGGCYLCPRSVWEKTHYGVPEDLHGCEHNWLCEQSGLPVFLSLNEMLWRKPLIYPLSKRVRVTLHLGRLVGR
jgi:hypothetical protein